MLTIDTAKKCVECGKNGATLNGLCLFCNSVAVHDNRPMKSQAGRNAQQYWRDAIAGILPE